MFGDRVLLKWKEPRYAQQRMVKQTSWREWAVMFGKFMGIYALGGLVIGFIIDIFVLIGKGFVFGAYLIGLLLLIAGAGAFFGLLAGLITFRNLTELPEVIVSEKGIVTKFFSGDYLAASCQEIQSCRIVKTKVEEQEVEVLEINFRNGNEAGIEIAPNIDSDAIIEILKTKNIQIQPALFKPI